MLDNVVLMFISFSLLLVSIYCLWVVSSLSDGKLGEIDSRDVQKRFLVRMLLALGLLMVILSIVIFVLLFSCGG